jgi:LmbE family N-acetylglucosaminyl deacetylase
MNPYLKFVNGLAGQVASARGLSVSGRTEPVRSGPMGLLFSPHPDDECITGLLALRLMREAGMQMLNVPVTFGRRGERQAARAAELKNACAYLGFQTLEKTAQRSAACFQGLEKADIVEVLNATRPRVIFMPHFRDWNVRHIATHDLVVEALHAMPDGFSCHVVETEFWGAMDTPNLMVEGDAQSVADLVAALSLHAGEVARNPYHLVLPAWMMDNVRRGGEVALGQGGSPPDFTFATLYRLSRWQNGRFFQTLEKGRALSCLENAGGVFDPRSGVPA